MSFCNTCGTRLNENARFCIKCGNKVALEDEDMGVKEVLTEQEDIAGKEVPLEEEDTAAKVVIVEDQDFAGNRMADFNTEASDSGAQALNFSKEEAAAAIESPFPLEAASSRKKGKVAAIVGVIVLLMLLLSGGGWYLIQMSSPDSMVENLARDWGSSKYESAYKYFEMDDRNSKVKDLSNEKYFVNWQKILDQKEGAVKSVSIKEIVIYERGWGKAEGSGKATLEIKRNNSKQEINLLLKSKPKKTLGLIPDWQLIFPSTVIDFGAADLLDGTEISLDGVKILTTGNITGDQLKVETFSGDHLVNFTTALFQPVEIYPAKDIEGVVRSNFIIKPDEEEAIKQAVMNLVKVEGSFWASQGRDLQSLMNVSANGSNYPGIIKEQVDDFMSQFDEYQICNSIKRTIIVSSIYDIQIVDADTVQCGMDALYDMQVSYSEKDYDWYTDEETYTNETYQDSGAITNTYTLQKEGGQWKIFYKY